MRNSRDFPNSLESVHKTYLYFFLFSMEDNDYSFGAMEDSSSRVSYGQGSEENGQGGDSSMVMEGGFSGKLDLN